MDSGTTSSSQAEQCTCTEVEKLHLGTVDQIVNDHDFLFIMSISMGVICQSISLFGVAGNLINIVVFIEQGFADKVNISLLALAVSDLTSLLFIMWSNICYTPVFRDSGLPFVAEEFQLFTGMWPHLIFTRITGWITAFISFERSMCVIRPLTVKAVFTRRVHIISMVTIFTFTIGCSMLAYVSLGLDWKFYPDRNCTLIGLVLRLNVTTRKIIDSVGYAVSGVFMPVTCFFSVLVFTVFLVVKLNQQAAWRKASSFTADDNKSSRNKLLNTRDQKVAKMVVFISVIFIICYLPAVGIFIAAYLEPQLSYDGVYRNMFLVLLSVSFTAEAINSSVNIFSYLSMSSKYRETLLASLRILTSKYIE